MQVAIDLTAFTLLMAVSSSHEMFRGEAATIENPSALFRVEGERRRRLAVNPKPR
jgi:hypothetical protein